MFDFIPPFFEYVVDEWSTTMVSIEPRGYKIERRGHGSRAEYRVSGPDIPTTVVGSLFEARNLVERKLRDLDERRRRISAENGEVEADDEADIPGHLNLIGFGFHEGRLFAMLFDARQKPTLFGHLDQLYDVVEQVGLDFHDLVEFEAEIEALAAWQGGLLFDGSNPDQWGVFDFSGRPSDDRFTRLLDAFARPEFEELYEEPGPSDADFRAPDDELDTPAPVPPLGG